jgi:hypothetical protein
VISSLAGLAVMLKLLSLWLRSSSGTSGTTTATGAGAGAPTTPAPPGWGAPG